MKICIAQTKSVKGDIDRNIENHNKMIKLAVSYKANSIFFPELSLTGYEPTLAKKLATGPGDKRFSHFQSISDAMGIIIGVGMPTNSSSGIRISMIIFQPKSPIQVYSKQQLHADEKPYFVCGMDQMFLEMDNKKIAPAICYESLLPEHAEQAFKCGAEIYVASVAKSTNGITKGFKHYPEIAKKYSMPVLMANCLGPSDDFESVGQSSVWKKSGKLAGQLDDKNEGILIFDTETEEIIKWKDIN